MRVYLAYAVVAAVYLFVSVQPVAAFNEMGIPFITSCDFVYMEPFSNTDLTIVEFNQASLFSHDFESVDINFPISTDGIVAGPTAGLLAAEGISIGAAASSNIIPFGPVNLAFPSIEQTVFQSEAYQRTYFFIDSIK